jgi:hypothetical protein
MRIGNSQEVDVELSNNQRKSLQLKNAGTSDSWI